MLEVDRNGSSTVVKMYISQHRTWDMLTCKCLPLNIVAHFNLEDVFLAFIKLLFLGLIMAWDTPLLCPMSLHRQPSLLSHSCSSHCHRYPQGYLCIKVLLYMGYILISTRGSVQFSCVATDCTLGYALCFSPGVSFW